MNTLGYTVSRGLSTLTTFPFLLSSFAKQTHIPNEIKPDQIQVQPTCRRPVLAESCLPSDICKWLLAGFLSSAGQLPAENCCKGEVEALPVPPAIAGLTGQDGLLPVAVV